jgi:hypothetical protein
MHRTLGLLLQGAGDHRVDPLVLDHARRAGSWFIAQAFYPLRQKAAVPLADCLGCTPSY